MKRLAAPPLALTLLSVATALSATPRYVHSRQVIVSAQPADRGGVDCIRLWVSLDGGQIWNEVPEDGVAAHSLRFDAPTDGLYEFYVVLENASGMSAPPPDSGAEPHISVVVDTVAPLLQVHRTAWSGTSRRWELLTFHCTLIEENLGPDGVRVFYRPYGAPRWCDGGTARFESGRIGWKPAPEAQPPFDLKLVVTDLAGNDAVAEFRNLAVPEGPTAESRIEKKKAPDGREPPLQSPSVSTAPIVGAARDDAIPRASPTAPASPPPDPPADPPEIRRLRQLAAWHLAEGRSALAAARLQDVLARSPADAGALWNLGWLSYRSQRYAEAEHQFQKVLELVPNHVGAIEGLALVAAAQRRYPQALEQWETLLRLAPQSGRAWLHYGDVQNRLGQSDQAARAWRRVLESTDSSDDERERAQRRLKYLGLSTGPR